MAAAMSERPAGTGDLATTRGNRDLERARVSRVSDLEADRRGRAGAAMLRLPGRSRSEVSAAGRANAGRDNPSYFVFAGFLVLGTQHEP
jgi:hypothetical protein